MKMKTNFFKYLKNDRGLGIVEVLIASAISIVILAATTILFTRNQDILDDQTDNARVQAKGRLAIDRIEEELRMAGFGMPPNQGITNIGVANSISFQSNLNDIRTTTPPCNPACPGAIANAGETTLTVVNTNGFAAGDLIVIRNPNSTNETEINTVTGIAGNVLSLGTPLAKTYFYGITTSLVTVNKYNNVTLALAGTTITRTVDGATTTMINDVNPANGLVFNYFGAATAANVIRLGFTVNLLDPLNANATVQFATEVSLRNS